MDIERFFLIDRTTADRFRLLNRNVINNALLQATEAEN